jgi:hypothetical protein
MRPIAVQQRSVNWMDIQVSRGTFDAVQRIDCAESTPAILNFMSTSGEWNEKEARERLRKLLRRLPSGSLAPLARMCGMKDRRFLWALTRSAWWFPSVRERLEAVMQGIESGQLLLIDTGKRCKNPAYPVLVWCWR